MSESTSVGWDTSLAGQSWSAPLNEKDRVNGSTSNNLSDSYLVDHMKTVSTESKPKDANDYSRFNNIGTSDSDDEQTKAKDNSSPVTPAPTSDTCRNCSKPGAKLKCSVCKKAVYCARSCQASDWTFHKRICKKPEVKKPNSPPKPSADNKPSSSSSSSSTTQKKSTKQTKQKSTEVVVDDPDLPNNDLRGYKNGLPYFHRELSEHEQNLIGDIAPQKIEVAPEVAQPLAHSGSAWNHAGTFEERNFTKWCEQKWSELFANANYTDGPHSVTFKDPEKITGDASICVVRGKKRFLFDFSFKLPFEVSLDGAVYKGHYQLNEISNDEDFEISYKLTTKPNEPAKASALQTFVSVRNRGLQKEVIRIVHEFIREYQNQ